MNKMIERYYELNKLMKHPEYSLSDDEIDEWTQLREDLLYEIMVQNILDRLKDR